MMWDPSLNTNIASVDKQHMKLIEVIETLDANIIHHHDADYIPSIIAFLDNYVAEHFKHEKELMLVSEYPNREKHLEAHADFILDFGDLKKQAEVEGISVNIVTHLHDFLYDWLVDHIQHIDMAFARFYNRCE